jgi:hypothetical protein
MKKITVWMLALMLVPGVVLLAGCKKAEEDTTAAEAMATPTPMEAEPVMEATPEVTPAPIGDNMAAPTPSPAAQ